METKGKSGCLWVILLGIVSVIFTLYLGFKFYDGIKSKIIFIVFTILLHWRFVQSVSAISNCSADISEQKDNLRWYNITSYIFMISSSGVYILGVLSIIMTLFNKIYSILPINIIEIGYILWMYAMFATSLNLWTCLSNIGYEGDVRSKQSHSIFEYFFYDEIIVVILYFLGWGTKFIFLPVIAYIGVLISVVIGVVLKNSLLKSNGNRRLKLFLVLMALVILGILFMIPHIYYKVL